MIEVVTGILIRTDGRVLLQRRAIDAAPEWSGAWNTPGGKVDIGETDEEALVREFKEEVCLDIAVGDYFAQVEFKVPILYAVTYYYVRGTTAELNPKINDRALAIGWFTLGEASNLNTTPGTHRILRQVQIMSPVILL